MHLKFEMCILEIHIEGSMSQNLDLGPSLYFIKCKILYIKNIQKLPDF